MAHERLKITLDTNCIINLFDDASETATSRGVLTSLVRYGLAGQAEISVTTRAEADLLNDRNPERRTEILRYLELLPVMGSVSEQAAELREEIQRIVFPG